MARTADIVSLKNGEINNKCRKYDGDHRKQLYKNVDGRSGSILEGVTNGVADNRCFVIVGALAAVNTALYILLCIIPSTAGV